MVLRQYDIGGGTKLAVEESGTAGAMPLILLHGAPNDSSTWAEVAPAFGASHHVFAVDLRELHGEVLARLPLARLAEIPVGHSIHRSAPSEFLEAVVPFLQET